MESEGVSTAPEVVPPAVSSTAPPSIFASNHRLIEEGDIVIVYHARDNIVAIKVTAGQMVPSRFGHFSQSDMIGVPFGSKFPTKTGKGFTYLLRPTPELWTLALPHRTQILYLPDIAYVTSQLDIGPGSRVIEAGTGSGSFSHAAARAMGPQGTLFSYEFHEDRFKKAREEFASHGLLAPEGAPITLQHKDIIKDGFEGASDVDAIFLDVPAPWDAIEAAKKVMNRRRISRICCFSPCIEQVQRTTTSLVASGFSDIAMYETLVRTHEPAVLPMPTIDEVVTRISEVEVRKEARRERQIRDAKRKREEKQAASVVVESTVVDGNETLQTAAAVSVDGPDVPAHKRKAEVAGESPAKKARLEKGPSDANESVSATEETEATAPTTNGNAEQTKAPERKMLKTSRPVDLLRGHTSFLTFASLLPDVLESMTNGDVSMEDIGPADATTAPAIILADAPTELQATQSLSTADKSNESSFPMHEADAAAIRSISDAELANLAETSKR